MMRNLGSKTLLLSCAMMLAASAAARAADQPRTGLWRAWLDSPGGELPFGLVLAHGSDRWQAWLVNNPESIEVPVVTWNGRELVLDMDYYDSKITAKTSNNGLRLDGEWRKRAAGGGWTVLAFHATSGEARRFHQRVESMF